MDQTVQSHQDGLRRNLLNSFGFQPSSKEGVDENKLEKGILSYQLASSQTFSITKSGKLIKEKLEAIKSVATQKLLECQSRYQNLRTQINEEPIQEADNYDTIMDLRIQPIPKTYSWDQISLNNGNEKGINSGSPYLGESPSPKETMAGDLMRQYNDSVYQYSSYKKDIAMIDTMLNNFSDTKNYELSVEQATIFGF